MGLIKPAKVIINKASESRLKSLQAEELKIQEQIKNFLEDLESNKKAAEKEGQRLVEIKAQVDNEAKKLFSISEEISRKQTEKRNYEIDLKKIEQCKKELERLAEKKIKNQNSQEQLIKNIEDKKEQLKWLVSSLSKTNLELKEKIKLREGISKDIATKSDFIYEINKDLERLRKEKDQILQDKKFIEKAKEEIPNYEVILKDIESSRSIKKSLTHDLKLLDSHLASKKKEIENLDRIIRDKRTEDFELTEKLGSLRREIARENARINSEKNKLITIKTEIQDLILEYRDKIKSEKLGKLVNQLNGK